ncbi:CBS domain-containing protein [Leekyejoonella antrihumi]|uniref:CBS domain-containing protein n=1 Tax=Leekyejoonella antrihumi TaxID=1660198 RepID=A0A563EA27_9MICO|nr:CBS domain-containing protein [Leekyejoonella antrihumi]TWP38644.1 CBS domain-containing protein [Leekyejoonella antrihumi]
MRLNEILRSKGGQVVTITPDAAISELVDLFARHNIGAAIVSQDGSAIDGIVSERDVVRSLRAGTDVLQNRVDTIMTSTVFSAKPTDTVDELARVMTEHRIRHVPVLEGDRIAGIVSIGDVVKSRIGELEFERNQLEGYIAGS